LALAVLAQLRQTMLGLLDKILYSQASPQLVGRLGDIRAFPVALVLVDRK
jgi:hypothetical protein